MDRDAVRAVSYNVRRDVAEDGDYDWDGRREAVVGTLRFHRPDLVGLQEPLPHQYADVRDGLDGFAWLGRSRLAENGDGEHCPIGYRTDRFECLDSGTLWLSESPAEPGSVGWDASWPRIVTWARLRDRRTDDKLAFLNTHLDHEGERARRESAALLLDRLPAIRDDGPALLTGDFNGTRESEAYAVLAGAGDRESPLVDARAVAEHPPHGPDTTRTDFESLLADRTIDHAFVAELAVRQFGVAADVVGDGWYPSDHLPLVVDVAVDE